jgi:hypothetical protein
VCGGMADYSCFGAGYHIRCALVRLDSVSDQDW